MATNGIEEIVSDFVEESPEISDTIVKTEVSPSSEPCLICLSSETCSDDTDRIDSSLKCLEPHLRSIFVLRNLLRWPKVECEAILRTTALSPGSWFSLCDPCARVVSQGLEIHQEIVKLTGQLEEIQRRMQNSLWKSFEVGVTFGGEQNAEDDVRSVYQLIRESIKGLERNVNFHPVEKVVSKPRARKRREIREVKSADVFSILGKDLDGNCCTTGEQNWDTTKTDGLEAELNLLRGGCDARTIEDGWPWFKNTPVNNKEETASQSAKPVVRKKRRRPKLLNGRLRRKTYNKGPQKAIKAAKVKRVDIPVMLATAVSDAFQEACWSPEDIPQNPGATSIVETEIRHDDGERAASSDQVESLTLRELGSRQGRAVARKSYAEYSESEGELDQDENKKSRFKKDPLFEPEEKEDVEEEEEEEDESMVVKEDELEDLVNAGGKKRRRRGPRSCPKCDFVPRSKNSKLKTHLATHEFTDQFEYLTENKKWAKCRLCGIEDTPARLYPHLREVHSIGQLSRDWLCHLCDKQFWTKTTLQSHIRVVHERRYSHNCISCSKGFWKKSDLEDHQLTHHSSTAEAGVNPGRKPYICEECGSSFLGRISLSKHRIRFHDAHGNAGRKRGADAQVLCKHCGEMVPKVQAWFHRKQAHFDLFVEKCEFCEERFMLVRHVKSHMQSKHKDLLAQQLTCDRCGLQCGKRRKYSQHRKICQGPQQSSGVVVDGGCGSEAHGLGSTR